MGIGFLLSAVAHATTVKPPEFGDLVNQADYIVRAVVKSVVSDYAHPGSHKILTWVELDVREIVAGTPPKPLVLRLLGGKVGDTEMIIEGAPQFKVGDDDIFFVRGNGHEMYPLVAMMHGIYPIKRLIANGPEFVTRSNAMPLHSTSETSLPLEHGVEVKAQHLDRTSAQGLSPDLFIAKIRAAVKPSNIRLNGRW
jgi:hypothetical protein